jgi:hypothetical protein
MQIVQDALIAGLLGYLAVGRKANLLPAREATIAA